MYQYDAEMISAALLRLEEKNGQDERGLPVNCWSMFQYWRVVKSPKRTAQMTERVWKMG